MTVNSWKVNGRLMGLPGLMNTYGYFYNKDLLKAAGVAEPKPGWTVDEFFADAQKLADPANKRFGIYNNNFDMFHVGMLNAAIGGAPFANGITKITKFTVDSSYKALTARFVDAIKNGYIMPPTFDTSSLESEFNAGKIPMYHNGQWMASGFIKNIKFNWGFVPNPVGKVRTSLYDCVGFASPAKIKNPDAVWKMLKYLDTKAYETVLKAAPVASTAYKPSAKPYFDTLIAAGHKEVADGVNYMLSSPNKQPIRALEIWAGDASRYQADWNNILEGKKPISLLDDMVKSMNEVIANYSK